MLDEDDRVAPLAGGCVVLRAEVASEACGEVDGWALDRMGGGEFCEMLGDLSVCLDKNRIYTSMTKLYLVHMLCVLSIATEYT